MLSLPARSRHRLGTLLRCAALALLVTGVAGSGVGPSAAAEPAHEEFPLTLDHGHIDAFTLLQEAGELRVALQEDVTGRHVLHEPGDVLLRVKEGARMTLPSPVPPSLAFLGKAGDNVHFLPQTQDPDLIWPGWSTERLSTADFRGPMRIHVDEVDGPGDVFVWQTGSFGESLPVLADGGHQLPGTIDVDVNAHVHANWAFTEPGRYTLTVRAAGTRRTGSEATSTPVDYTFEVGDTDAEPSPGPDPEPTPDPDPDPTPDPDPQPEPDPEPRAVWDVPNGTVNKRGATVLNKGHVDVASLLDRGRLSTRIKDTTRSSAAVWRNPAKTVLQLLPSSRTTVPSGAAYSFLGSPGSSLYQVTQVQQSGLLWPGWSTESIAADATTGGVAWALSDVSGPGDFALYETDPFGQPTVLFNTRDGINGKDRFTIPKLTHAHGSWAFSKQGNYCLSMQRVAETSTGRTVSDQFVLAVAVGRADVMRVDPAACGKEVETDPPVTDPPKVDDNGTGSEGTGDEAPSHDVPATECTTGATILSAGHVDYASRIIDGSLQSQVGDDTSGAKVYREPSETILWLKPASKVTLPSGYGQVGASGSTVWQVPQTQDPALIWLGWNTETLNAGNARGPITWRLDKVEGPGTVKVYLSGSFGGVQAMVLGGAGSSYSIDLGVHAHANWAFSAQGIYRLTTTQTVTLANGRRSSDTEVLTIAVGDLDPASAAAGEHCAPGSAEADDGDSVAVPQAVAPPVVATGIAPLGATDGVVASRAGAGAEEDPVPLLLGTLGGLLLLGSGGSGMLWWRGTRRQVRG
ncbi:TIGR03773 family transporter-associated surface protein [Nocardioides daejeonensis]|uniref:TIGR03773 family transporter-associated surface protein n=1 Tax=Nocardioides daejeonensis TaxID=1046556 RepID=UPI000D74928E|nr:TIGR03773 family transporter-associated surface protein [Nocardioides daejeonensis]